MGRAKKARPSRAFFAKPINASWVGDGFRYSESASSMCAVDRSTHPTLRSLPRRRSRDGHRPARGFRNGKTKPFGKAGVAPIVHVQPVGRHECIERQPVGLLPMPHDGETAEDTDFFLFGHGGKIRIGSV